MLKVLCQYLYYRLSYSLNKESRPIVIMPNHQKSTKVPRVILDVLDVMGRPQGSYAKVSCKYISYWLRYLLNKVIMPTNSKLTKILHVMDRPQGSYADSFVSILFFTLREIIWKFGVNIFIWSVSRMGFKKGGDLEDVEGSWHKTLRTGSSKTLCMYLLDPKDHILKDLCHYL